MRRPARPAAPRDLVVRSWSSWNGFLFTPVKLPGLVHARPDGLTCTVSDPRRGRQSGVWSCQGRFVLRLGLRPVPPASWGGTCRGWVRLLADERSHWTLTPARNQVATGIWVRSCTISAPAHPLPRHSMTSATKEAQVGQAFQPDSSALTRN